MLEALETSTEAYLGLYAVGTHGASGVGRYSMRFEKEQRSSTSGLEPPRGMTDDLLPIPLSVAKPFLIAQCSCNRGAREAEMVEGALGMLAALNFLNGSAWTDHPIFPQRRVILGPAHERVLRHLWDSSVAFMDRGMVPFFFR